MRLNNAMVSVATLAAWVVVGCGDSASPVGGIERSVFPLLPYSTVLTEDVVQSAESLLGPTSELGETGLNMTAMWCQREGFGWWQTGPAPTDLSRDEQEIVDSAKILTDDIAALVNSICDEHEFDFAWVDAAVSIDQAAARLHEDLSSIREVPVLNMTIQGIGVPPDTVVAHSRPARGSGLISYDLLEHAAAFEPNAWLALAGRLDTGDEGKRHEWVLGWLQQPAHDWNTVEIVWLSLRNTDLTEEAWQTLPRL